MIAAACVLALLPSPPRLAPLRPARHPPLASAAPDSYAAYAAGRKAVTSAVQPPLPPRPPGAPPPEREGRQFKVLLKQKPLGLVLAENPSGRGAYVAEVSAASPAAAAGVCAGDFLVDVVNPRNGSSFRCVWLPLADILPAIEALPPPLALRLRRGGAEPWTIEREGSGLSVEDMMREARGQFGRLIDEEKEREDALRTAFATLKQQERQRAVDGGFESDTLRAAARLRFELRAFVRGAADAIDAAKAALLNRAAVDARVAVQAAEYVLRRAIVDSAFLVESGRAALALGAAPTPRRQPFEERLAAVSGGRALAAGDVPTREEEEARAARLRAEAKDVLSEALRGVEALARRAAEGGRKKEGGEEGEGKEEEPDWELLQQRAALLGGELGQSVQQGLQAVRVDFLAFKQLGEAGQMPTLLEEITESNAPRSPQEDLAAAAQKGAAPLGAFADQDSPAEQRRRRQQRRQTELDLKQIKVVAAAGERASKDSSDLLVFGVLPGAKAIGKMAARRVAQGISGERSTSTGIAGMVSELASELAKEYADEIQRGKQLGPLAGIAEAVEGPTKKMKEDLLNMGNALMQGPRGGALAPKVVEEKPPQARRPLAAASDATRGAAEAPPRRGPSGGARPVADEFAQAGMAIFGSAAGAAQRAVTDVMTSAQQATPATRLSLSPPSPPCIPRKATLAAPFRCPQTAEEKRARVQELRAQTSGARAAPPAAAPSPPPASTPRGEEAEVWRSAAIDVDSSDEAVSVEVLVSEAAPRFPRRKAAGGSELAVVAAEAEEEEAFDVQASEEQDEPEASERSARVVDAALLLLEIKFKILGGRIALLLTPNKERSWRLLKAFSEEDYPSQQSAMKAQEVLLDSLAEIFTRK
ncbi:hypothetical protein AB1Y20_002446 [Prymnesium parvum]|uniref:PDZ domain-containing protein n=1 Tax=Prymnesium parvum TaxID=97485 RepID=A0AB34JAD8_PRYPA